jgi:small subunit ribosomal protein S1
MEPVLGLVRHLQVTKYNPAHRDPTGRYVGPEQPVSDHGVTEAAYLQAVREFAADAAVPDLVVRDPELGGLNFGLEPHVEGYGLPRHLGLDRADFYDGARVSVEAGVELVRAMLHDNGAWCRLEHEDAFALEVGFDQYMYISTRSESARAQAAVEALGLFLLEMDGPSYDLANHGTAPPAGPSFWAEVYSRLGDGHLLLQEFVAQQSRWHRIDQAWLTDGIPSLTPRAGVMIWPDLTTPDTALVLERLAAEDGSTLVWLGKDGALRSAELLLLDAERAKQVLRQALLATLVPFPWEAEPEPFMLGVLPDEDGCVRARWSPNATEN